jgi:hypothetical protein
MGKVTGHAMIYGPHTILVDEVVNFAQSGPLLKPVFRELTGHQIHDVNEAKMLAWERTYGTEGCSWTDIREREMSVVKGSSYSTENFSPIRAALSDLGRSLNTLIRPRLGPEHRELLDDIAADLNNCAFSRAVLGDQNAFFENLFSIYKAGGWPCGWYGEYPQGRAMVYTPPA